MYMSNSQLSEFENVQLALRGNKAAMDGLLLEAKPWIKALAKRALKTAEDGAYKNVECLVCEEDLIQEGLMVFVQKLGSFSGDYGTKLSTFTYNYVKAAMRDLIDGVMHSLPVGDTSQWEEALEPQETLSSVALYHCMTAYMRRHLNPREVEAVELFYGLRTGHSMRAAEVAQAMNLSLCVFNHTLDRARQKLRKFRSELGNLSEDCLPSASESMAGENLNIQNNTLLIAA